MTCCLKHAASDHRIAPEGRCLVPTGGPPTVCSSPVRIHFPGSLPYDRFLVLRSVSITVPSVRFDHILQDQHTVDRRIARHSRTIQIIQLTLTVSSGCSPGSGSRTLAVPLTNGVQILQGAIKLEITGCIWSR